MDKQAAIYTCQAIHVFSVFKHPHGILGRFFAITLDSGLFVELYGVIPYLRCDSLTDQGSCIKSMQCFHCWFPLSSIIGAFS